MGQSSPIAPVILVDDARDFADGRQRILARTLHDALAVFDEWRGRSIRRMALDHDLGRAPNGTTIDVRPLVFALIEAAHVEAGRIEVVTVHTANSRAAVWMVRELRAAGYCVQRDYDVRQWVHRYDSPNGIEDNRA